MVLQGRILRVWYTVAEETFASQPRKNVSPGTERVCSFSAEIAGAVKVMAYSLKQ